MQNYCIIVYAVVNLHLFVFNFLQHMHHYSITAYAVVNLHVLLFLYTLTMACKKPKHVAVGFISEFKLCLIYLFVYHAFVFIFDSFGKE